MNQKLYDLRSELDEMDGLLTTLFKEFEETMASMRLGVPFRLATEDFVLTFEKLNGAWRLLIDGDPISDISRDRRAKVTSRIAALYDAIPSQMEEKVAQRREAVATMKQALQTVKNKISG